MGAAVTKKLRGHRGGGNRSLVSGPEELRRSPASQPPAAAHWRRRLFIRRGLVRSSCQDSAAARLKGVKFAGRVGGGSRAAKGEAEVAGEVQGGRPNLSEAGLSRGPVGISKCERDRKAIEMVMVAMESNYFEN